MRTRQNVNGNESSDLIWRKRGHDYKVVMSVGMDCLSIGKHDCVPRNYQLSSLLDLSTMFQITRVKNMHVVLWFSVLSVLNFCDCIFTEGKLP